MRNLYLAHVEVYDAIKEMPGDDRRLRPWVDEEGRRGDCCRGEGESPARGRGAGGGGRSCVMRNQEDGGIKADARAEEIRFKTWVAREDHRRVDG